MTRISLHAKSQFQRPYRWRVMTSLRWFVFVWPVCFFFCFPAALPVIVRTVLYICLQSRTSTSPFLALEIFKFRTQHPQQLHKHQQEPTTLLCIGGAGGGPGERVVLLCNWERFEGRDDKDAAWWNLGSSWGVGKGGCTVGACWKVVPSPKQLILYFWFFFFFIPPFLFFYVLAVSRPCKTWLGVDKCSYCARWLLRDDVISRKSAYN